MDFATDRPAFHLHRGQRPLLISMPHVGTHVPPALAQRLTPEAQQVPDTDWHLETLYAFAREMGIGVIAATHSRYVVDLNRPPDDTSLYPGQDTTGLCPLDTFDKQPLYLSDAARPDAAEIAARRAAIWQPYHDALNGELQRLRRLHPAVLLWDAHSIRSVVPRFFEGRLPDLNLGTAGGSSCDTGLAEQLLAVARADTQFSAVLNGRFKGGHITRHYGRPVSGIHAVQLEMAQCCYMEEAPPFSYRPDLAAAVQPVLRRLLETALAHVEAARP